MLIRIFRAIVKDGKNEEFRTFFLRTALPLVRDQDGLEDVYVGFPGREQSAGEFAMITVWRDIDALKSFSGEDWEKPVIHPDEAHLLEQVFVHHYEMAEALSQ